MPEAPEATSLDKFIGRRRMFRLSAVVAIVAVIVVVARWPATTSVGFNYVVTVKQLMLFEKAIAFVDRDLQMRRLTREIAGVGGTPEQRLLRMYNWVIENIQPVPPGLPVVDDHVRSIFVRGYGANDQRAEALAALASYDGMPAATAALGKDPNRRLVQLTLVSLADQLVVLDVNSRIVFRKPSGELATLEDLQTDPSIIRGVGAGIVVDGELYHEHLARLKEVDPNFLRMESQRFWPRLVNELFGRLSLQLRRESRQQRRSKQSCARVRMDYEGVEGGVLLRT